MPSAAVPTCSAGQISPTNSAAATWPSGGHHIHGANLGVSVAAYLAVGGFAPLVAHEDVKLIGTLKRHGFTIDWLQTMRVKTSARRESRAPEGLGALLHSLEENRAGDFRRPDRDILPCRPGRRPSTAALRSEQRLCVQNRKATPNGGRRNCPSWISASDEDVSPRW